MDIMRAPSLASLALLVAWFTPTAIFSQEVGGDIQNVDRVGFQQFQEVSRVFVRTTEKAKYRIDSSREGMVVIILERSRIPLRNNRRPLDTRYFDSPVGYIKPKVIEGASSTVRIEITLRQQVPYQEVQEDNMLALDFKRM